MSMQKYACCNHTLCMNT